MLMMMTNIIIITSCNGQLSCFGIDVHGVAPPFIPRSLICKCNASNSALWPIRHVKRR